MLPDKNLKLPAHFLAAIDQIKFISERMEIISRHARDTSLPAVEGIRFQRGCRVAAMKVVGGQSQHRKFTPTCSFGSFCVIRHEF
jgi:hypothetical protein